MKTRFLWRALKARYRDQIAELSAIRQHIRPGDTVCDIGANKGSYTYWLARWARGGKVFAFEPQESLSRYLRDVCALMEFDHVFIETKAVYAKTGSKTLYVPSEDVSPGASLSMRVPGRDVCRTVEVSVVALDDYFEPDHKVSVLKIDVEGAESAVFEGAKRILTEQSPLIVFECENRHLESGDVWDVFAGLTTLGYNGQFVCGRQLRPLCEFDASKHQMQEGDRFWDAKGYCNNFVFSKRR